MGLALQKQFVAYRQLKGFRYFAVTAIAVLLITLTLTFVFIFFTPYPGFAWSPTPAGWHVMGIPPCQCAKESLYLQPEDLIIQIDDLDFQTHQTSWGIPTFAGVQPGQELALTVIRQGQLLQVHWSVPSISFGDRLWRLVAVLFYLPFWILGTLTWFLTAPTNSPKTSAITLTYLITFWFALAPLAPWQLLYSALLFHLLAWYIAGLIVYLHLLSPVPLLRGYTRPVTHLLWLITTALAIGDGLFLIPRYAFLYGLVFVFVITLIILVSRLLWGLPSEKLVARSLLVGNLLTIVPVLILLLLTFGAANLPPQGIVLILSSAITFAPLFYIHAFYRRQLGRYEAWASRLLRNYAFFFLLGILIFVLVNLSGYFISGREQTITVQFQLLLVTALIILGLLTRPGFRQRFNQLIYGIENQAALIQDLADQIPLATERKSLATLLNEQFMPRLKISQSAIYLLDKAEESWFYHTGVEGPLPVNHEMNLLRQQIGQYRPEEKSPLTAWVRLAIPIKSGQQIIGLWLFGRRPPDNFYTQADIATLTTFANQIAPVISNINLLEETQRQLAEQTALLAAVQATLSSLELEVILNRLCQILGQAINASSVYFCRWDDNQQSLTTVSEYYAGRATPNERKSDLGFSRPIAKEPHRQADSYRKGILTSLHIDNPTLQEAEQQYLRQYDAKSILYLPLFSQNQVIGHFEIWESQQKRIFNRHEIALCQAITSQATLAVENAILFAAEHYQLKVARTLQKVGRLLTTDLTLDEVYEAVFDLLAENIRYDSVSIQLLGQDGYMYLVAARGFTDLEAVKWFVRHNKPDIDQMQSEENYVTYIPDTTLDPRWIDFEATKHILCWVGVVLQIKGRPVGVLNLDISTKNAYSPDDLRTIAAFANQVVVALENARLYRQIQEKANQGQILHQVALHTSNLVQSDEIIEQTTQIIMANLPYDCFGFLTIDPAGGWFTPHPSATTFPPNLSETITPLTGSLLDTIVQSGQAQLVHKSDQQNGPAPMLPEMACEMIVPIKIQQQIIGALLASSRQPFAFDHSNLQFLSTLASQIALAIERTELYHIQQRTMANLSHQVFEQTNELQMERDRTRIILENAGEGIFLASPTGIILYVNPATMKLTGFDEDEVLGQALLSWLRIENNYQPLQEAIANGQNWHGELLGKRKDSLLFEFYLILAPIYDEHHSLTGFVGVQADLARIKEVERLKAELLANVSHELRTPLTNIKMYLNLLQRGKEEKRGYYLDILESETDRLTGLIQDLLVLSQLKAVPVDRDWVNLGIMLKNVCAMLANRAQEQQLWLDCQLEENLPQVLGEERLLNQAFMNLVNNALAFSPAGKRVIVRGQVSNSGDWPMIQLLIQDGSRGLPAGELALIFDRFYRGRSARLAGQTGAGQGLAVVKEIIDRHKGHLRAQNHPTEGVQFIIELPIENKPSL